ncbi:MAG: hypothetical protein ACRCRU_00455 [Vibrio sp.]|uniref:hypothetical protein n=1 Tax=Vibrio sp. TaxID=678 RepID=UPI003F2D9093
MNYIDNKSMFSANVDMSKTDILIQEKEQEPSELESYNSSIEDADFVNLIVSEMKKNWKLGNGDFAEVLNNLSLVSKNELVSKSANTLNVMTEIDSLPVDLKDSATNDQDVEVIRKQNSESSIDQSSKIISNPVSVNVTTLSTDANILNKDGVDVSFINKTTLEFTTVEASSKIQNFNSQLVNDKVILSADIKIENESVTVSTRSGTLGIKGESLFVNGHDDFISSAKEYLSFSDNKGSKDNKQNNHQDESDDKEL